MKRVPGLMCFIGASEKNNGITDMCDLEPMFDVQVLTPKEDVTRWALIFVATIIRVEKSRFSYGYKWKMARMKKTAIRLPVVAAGEPDW